MYLPDNVKGTIYFVLGCVVLYFGIKWGDQLIVTKEEAQEIQIEKFIKKHYLATPLDFANNVYTTDYFDRSKLSEEYYIEARVGNIYNENGKIIAYVCANVSEEDSSPTTIFQMEITKDNSTKIQADWKTQYGFVLNYLESYPNSTKNGTIVECILKDYLKL